LTVELSAYFTMKSKIPTPGDEHLPFS